MITNSEFGLGDDSSGEALGGADLSGIVFILAGLGALVFLKAAFGSSSNKKSGRGVKRVRMVSGESGGYKLLVDVTGRGNWVEQARGSKREVSSVATKVKKQEGMQTKIEPV